MAQTKEPSKAKLIIGIMYSEDHILAQTLFRLIQKFGPIEINGPLIPFTFTDYYQEEMGQNLKKSYFAFVQKINQQFLPEIKQFTNAVEQQLSKESKRMVNIDPGYVTEHQVVLASAKEHPHRMYLANGVYGQIVLIYSRNQWIPVDKTFEDYKQKEVQEFLISVRNKY